MHIFIKCLFSPRGTAEHCVCVRAHESRRQYKWSVAYGSGRLACFQGWYHSCPIMLVETYLSWQVFSLTSLTPMVSQVTH